MELKRTSSDKSSFFAAPDIAFTTPIEKSSGVEDDFDIVIFPELSIKTQSVKDPPMSRPHKNPDVVANVILFPFFLYFIRIALEYNF